MRKTKQERTIYRIEHPDLGSGMWYDEGVPLKRIHLLCPNSPAKDAPMPYDPRRRLNGKEWFSAGKSVENMNEWFTTADALNLLQHGYKLYEMVITEWQDLPYEILFTKEGICQRREIPIDHVFS